MDRLCRSRPYVPADRKSPARLRMQYRRHARRRRHQCVQRNQRPFLKMMNRRNQTIAADVERGWRRDAVHVSLPEVHRSIVVPVTASFWRKLVAFSGPGFLVAVGYMDPGNWATDLAGGAQFGYSLLAVVMSSNLMAILLQHLCIKLGVATGRDLAQACRDHYPRPIV